jgi:hypothetical protein
LKPSCSIGRFSASSHPDDRPATRAALAQLAQGQPTLIRWDLIRDMR